MHLRGAPNNALELPGLSCAEIAGGFVIAACFLARVDLQSRRQLSFTVRQQEEQTKTMNETAEKAKCPTSITVVCVIGFIGALITVPLIFSPLAQQVGSWYAPYIGFSAVIGLACMVGLWMMRK